MVIPEQLAKTLSHSFALFPPLVCMGVVFGLFRRVFPANPQDAHGKSLDQLTTEYKSWERRTGLIFFLLVAPLIFLLWFLLKSGAHWYFGYALPPAEVTFLPFAVYWVLPAIFLGLVAAAPILFRISHTVLKDRYPEYLAYQSMRYGFDSAKANDVTMAAVAVICAFLIFFGLRTYVQLQGDTLVVSGYFAGESRHDLADTAKIETAPALTAPNGNTVKRREYLITFKDGSSWTTSSLLSRVDDKGKQDFVNLLSQKAGVPVTEIPVFPQGAL